jgi:hypothetical protein
LPCCAVPTCWPVPRIVIIIEIKKRTDEPWWCVSVRDSVKSSLSDRFFAGQTNDIASGQGSRVLQAEGIDVEKFPDPVSVSGPGCLVHGTWRIGELVEISSMLVHGCMSSATRLEKGGIFWRVVMRGTLVMMQQPTLQGRFPSDDQATYVYLFDLLTPGLLNIVCIAG